MLDIQKGELPFYKALKGEIEEGTQKVEGVLKKVSI